MMALATAFPRDRFLIRCAAQSAWISFAGTPPDLFGVSLEERAVEAPAKPAYHPALEVGGVFRRANPSGGVGANTRECLDQAQIPECVHRPQGVVEELAVVVNATHARTQQKVGVRKDLVPEGLNPRNLREKAVPTEVKSPTVPLDGPTLCRQLVCPPRGHRRRCRAEPVRTQLSALQAQRSSKCQSTKHQARHTRCLLACGVPQSDRTCSRIDE